MMQWMRRWWSKTPVDPQPPVPAIMPVHQVDGIAWFAQIDIMLAKKATGGWIAHASNWNIAARGSTALEAVTGLVELIQLQCYSREYWPE